MECKNIQTEIDRWVFQEIDKPGNAIYEHITGCPECYKYFEESKPLYEKIKALRHREPFLRNPEGMTDRIISAIRVDPCVEVRGVIENNKVNRNIFILKRTLAAACIGLFMIFSYEQYVVVDKIAALENQNQTISLAPQYQSLLMAELMISALKKDPRAISSIKEWRAGDNHPLNLLKVMIWYDLALVKVNDLQVMKIKGSDEISGYIISALKKSDSIH